MKNKEEIKMKKFALILAAVMVVAAVAYAAEIALGDYSFDQLIALQKQITAEIMSRPEWKEVTVPAGTWSVGDDIPAGTYSMTPTNYAVITIWRKAENDYSNNGLFYNEMLDEDESCGKIKLEDGMIVVLSGSIVFAPPLSLGF